MAKTEVLPGERTRIKNNFSKPRKGAAGGLVEAKPLQASPKRGSEAGRGKRSDIEHSESGGGRDSTSQIEEPTWGFSIHKRRKALKKGT